MGYGVDEHVGLTVVVRFDNWPSRHESGCYQMLPFQLEPIQPPGTFTLESELSRIFGHEVSIGPDFQPRPRVTV